MPIIAVMGGPIFAGEGAEERFKTWNEERQTLEEASRRAREAHHKAARGQRLTP